MDLAERIQEISIHEENIQEITTIKTQDFQVSTEMEEEKTQEITTKKIEESKSISETLTAKWAKKTQYSEDFKREFIECYKAKGLTVACLLKHVSIDTASGWVSKYKKEGYDGLKDKRKFNGKQCNQELDDYVLGKFKEQRQKAIVVTSSMIQLMALNAPLSIRPADFKASKGWLYLFLKRNNITRRKCTQKIQAFVDSLLPEINNYLQVLEVLQDNVEDYVFINFDEIPFFRHVFRLFFS